MSPRQLVGSMHRVGTWLVWAWLALASGLASADCPQVTNWSNEDVSYFPVERVTRLDHGNSPGWFYFDVDNVQDLSNKATYFSVTASPSKTVDQRFANAVSLNIMSFASNAAAQAVFNKDVAKFNQINPVRWNYQVMVPEAGTMAYFSDTNSSSKELNYITVYQNAIVRIRLLSASTAETVLGAGFTQMANRINQSRSLVQQKCGVNGAPSISLVADQGSDLSFQSAFQRAMAGGKITVRATDPNGRGDLDWSSFRLFVAGVDKTGNALQVVQRLAAAGKIAYVPSGEDPSTEEYQLQVDPAKLMGEHNFFNIPWNGEWPVTLKICDRKGACGQQDLRLYFGPYLAIRGFYDNRYTSPTTHTLGFWASWGNNGHDALSNFYVVLAKTQADWQTWTTDYWSLSMGVMPPVDLLQWFDTSFGIQRVFGAAPILLTSGMSKNEVRLDLATTAFQRPAKAVDLGSGLYSLGFGAVDLTQTALRIEQEHNVRLCSGS